MWKPIIGFENQYEISDNGLVKSVQRKIVDTKGHEYILEEKILKPNKIKNGYLCVYLSKDSNRYPKYIHRLVAETFVDNPGKYNVVNHIDGNKDNNSKENLEWCNYSQNNQHAYDTHLKGKGEYFYNSKLTENNVSQIKAEGKYDTYRKIGEKYGVSGATIRDVLLGITWKDVN